MIELIVYGIVLGSIIAVASIGLTLIWGITGVFNCAHGDQMTVGAYVALLFVVMFSKITLIPKLLNLLNFQYHRVYILRRLSSNLNILRFLNPRLYGINLLNLHFQLKQAPLTRLSY